MPDGPEKNRPLFTRKRILIVILVLAAGIGLAAFYLAFQVKTQMRAMFKLNKQLQEQNYYLADFERKMLGAAYLIDKGRYLESLTLLNRYHDQLQTKNGLIKIPKFATKEEELDFYLNLQNPKTGAFMDEAYPFCTYHGSTEDVLLHIAGLASETGCPVKLKYRLNYLDRINTPEKVTAFLNDVSTVGPLASKFPQTSFHFARDILFLACDPKNHSENEVDMLIENHKLYQFSPEWKKTVLTWFYEHQDPDTGLWGPRSKKGKLRKKDLNNTSSILKAFVDKNGNNIHDEFPLRYKKELFASALEVVSEPAPSSDDSLDEFHEWNLKTTKALRMLTRYLWKDASPENKNKARAAMAKYIRLKCELYYLPEEGAFSYYPHSQKASLDGFLSFSTFKEIGALSAELQEFLWGSPDKNIKGSRSLDAAGLTPNVLKSIADAYGVNSFRFYQTPPVGHDLTSGVFAVVYPYPTPVPDIMDLKQRMTAWINATDQSLGNWTSRANVHRELNSIDFPPISVFEEPPPSGRLQEIFRNNNELVVIGFDALQIPCYQIIVK